MFLIHKEQHSKYSFVCFFFIWKLCLFEKCSSFFIIKINCSFFNTLHYVFFIFPSSVNISPRYLNFVACCRASSSFVILIFSGSLEQTITSFYYPTNFHYALFKISSQLCNALFKFISSSAIIAISSANRSSHNMQKMQFSYIYSSPTPASSIHFVTCDASKNITNMYDSKRFHHETTCTWLFCMYNSV